MALTRYVGQRHFHCPLLTSNPNFKVMPLFIAEYFGTAIVARFKVHMVCMYVPQGVCCLKGIASCENGAVPHSETA